MMDTPICDFVRRYAQTDTLRLHMPGHKGSGELGVERLDITEISGADSLYAPDGIIARSEENASLLFGCPTFYSTEGASHCIRAMLHLATQGGNRVVAAARNVHSSFLTAAALLDLQVRWLYPEDGSSYLSCALTPENLDKFLQEETVAAVYVTSPDYLGNVADIAALAQVCHRYGVLLLVDNAHGAYLRFLQPSRHPMDLGADMCCDSAHKTLPVLTGGAYLHIADGGQGPSRTPVPTEVAEDLGDCHGRKRPRNDIIKAAMALFGSTSPSYLILQSLDMANRYLAEGYTNRLSDFVTHVEQLKNTLTQMGWVLTGNDPLRLTVAAKAAGYTGTQLAKLLRALDVECEFSDSDFLVLMLTPENGMDSLRKLRACFAAIPVGTALVEKPPAIPKGEPVLSVRQAMLAQTERLPVAQCMGRVLSTASISCPPAVPILVSGERISAQALACLRYYGITECTVVSREH